MPTCLLGRDRFTATCPKCSLSTADNAHADLRSHVQVLVGLAKTCPRALAPHLAAMATQVQEMWQQGLLWAGERNVLCDGLVITAGTDNPSVQSQVGSQPGLPIFQVQVWLSIFHKQPAPVMHSGLQSLVRPEAGVCKGSNGKAFTDQVTSFCKLLALCSFLNCFQRPCHALRTPAQSSTAAAGL